VNRIIKQRQWLYLLTALVLLMQSFAIWHNATHPFHLASEQCHQFDSISHTPSLDLIAPLLPQLTTQYCIPEPAISITYATKRVRDNHAIRAPPVLS
jgi:hypothetical protein